MKNIANLFAILLIVATSSIVRAEDPELANIFKSRNAEGTIVISSLDGKKTYIHNDARAKKRFLPASTFKIPNTLIALEERAVGGGKEIVKWDGQDKGLPAWNQDQSIETAFQASCVWFYQELAKRVGLEKYVPYLQSMQYGNGNAGPETTTFWLEGDLAISAVEQVAFLKNVYSRLFPFKASSYDLLANAMEIEKTPSYTVRAKTGWAMKPEPMVGWFVGYVETMEQVEKAGQAEKTEQEKTVGQVWFFATNIDILESNDTILRKEIAFEALKIKGITREDESRQPAAKP